MDWNTTTTILVNALMLFPIAGMTWLAVDTYKGLTAEEN